MNPIELRTKIAITEKLLKREDMTLDEVFEIAFGDFTIENVDEVADLSQRKGSIEFAIFIESCQEFLNTMLEELGE